MAISIKMRLQSVAMLREAHTRRTESTWIAAEKRFVKTA